MSTISKEQYRMLHSQLERQIKFVKLELSEELSPHLLILLQNKLETLTDKYNNLTRQAEALRWHFH